MQNIFSVTRKEFVDLVNAMILLDDKAEGIEEAISVFVEKDSILDVEIVPQEYIRAFEFLLMKVVGEEVTAYIMQWMYQEDQHAEWNGKRINSPEDLYEYLINKGA